MIALQMNRGEATTLKKCKLYKKNKKKKRLNTKPYNGAEEKQTINR